MRRTAVWRIISLNGGLFLCYNEIRIFQNFIEEEYDMEFNFIGIPLSILFLASVAGILFGLLRKNRKVLNISLVMLAIAITIYILVFFVVH
ncbi:MAG: hypothetical protein H6Q58_60 [Firmicutes bacterium]|nr:hypothetical protein [Bacillota bacterium]